MPSLAGSLGAAQLAVVLAVTSLLLYLFVPDLGTMLTTTFSKLSGFVAVAAAVTAAAQAVDLNWHAPAQTELNDLAKVIEGTGVYGFIYNSSRTPEERYGVHNWCNMPHARRKEYAVPPKGFELKYVEVVQRHHKRTPYASNSFPVEPYRWNCDDQRLYYYGEPVTGNTATPHYWRGHVSDINPFVPSGWIGSCQFPQITAGGFDDSYQHGDDLYQVYHDLLGFLPARDADWRSKVAFRITNNVITSQVAGMLISGMWRTSSAVPVIIQAAGVDSLEPQYSCPRGSDAFNAIKSANTPAWKAHLEAAAPLYAVLDSLSGVPPNDGGFHASLDHYYDNLSARQCHDKPFPCKLVDGRNSSDCVDQSMADTTYRLGHWEYSRIYRDDPRSLPAAVATWGVFIAELAVHLREAVSGGGGPVYFHNIAHDGSISRLLAILQIDNMVWPGMGSEVVFELWKKHGDKCEQRAARRQTANSGAAGSGKSASGLYVRVLFSGQVLKSSNPSLGKMDMVPVETLLAYFDGLVGERAALIKGKCSGSIPL